MRLTIPIRDLKRELPALKKACDSRSTIPIFTHLLIVAGEGQSVTLTTTDLDVYRRVTLSAATVNTPGSATVCLRQLEKFLKSVKGPGSRDRLLCIETVQGSKDSVRYSVQDGPSITLPTMDPTVYPAVPDFPAAPATGDAVLVPGENWNKLVRRTRFCIPNDDRTNTGRFTPPGALMEMDAGQLRLVATDGERMSLAECPAPTMPVMTSSHNVIIPLWCMNDADGSMVRILNTPDHILIQSADVGVVREWIGRRTTIKFPDYRRVLPTPESMEFCLTVSREALLAALEACRPSTGGRSRGVTMTLTAGYEGAGRLRLENMKSPFAEDVARFSQELSCSWSGMDGFRVGANVDFLIQGLRESEYGVLQMFCNPAMKVNKPGYCTHLVGPMLFTFQPGYTYVVMPVRPDDV